MANRLWRFCFLASFGLAVLRYLAVGQAQQAIEPVPTIRANTRLVLVDVVVTDKSGKPVGNLKADDFTVQEKGKNQKVAFFTSAQEKQQQGPPTALGNGIYSNKPEYRSPGGPIVIILLDAVNTPFKDQAYARRQMLQFIREQYKPGQRTAVLTLTNSLGILQDFTEDPDVLLLALQRFQPKEQEGTSTIVPRPPSTASGIGSGNAERAAAAMAQRIQSFQDIQVAFVEERRVQVTLEGMRSLARFLGGIPGRKSVVWVTASFPFSLIPENRAVTDAEMAESLPTISQLSLGTRSSGSNASSHRESHSQEIREAAAQLASAQVAFYPVDARGLVTGMEATMADLPSRRFQSMDESVLTNISDVSASQETMKEMARETGGLAYTNQNEIKEGVAIAMNDGQSFYTLGYYPEDKKWDGKYRTIKIKVNRDGLDARYRKGYFAIDSTELKDRKPEQEVAEALQDRGPATLVTFSAQIKPAEKSVSVDFLVDPTTVSAEDVSGGQKRVNMVLYAAMFSPDGKMLGNRSLKVDQAFDTATYQKILQQGMLLHIDLEQSPSKGNEIRLAVRDNRTGNIGTLIAPANPTQ
ncbi:MAG TPA: VWA domain-containing protein [Terriglobales bacterium]|nr:VWA domain-containing protein [Terriglobales bacterium]